MESAAKSTDKALGLYGMIHFGIISSDIVQNYTLSYKRRPRETTHGPRPALAVSAGHSSVDLKR